MDLRKTFNEDEYNYDKARPDYRTNYLRIFLIMSVCQKVAMFSKLV